tara:strand:+ start:57489 stop:57761 length:273 start_codon:yes stop_codon:yes gene_type:complete
VKNDALNFVLSIVISNQHLKGILGSISERTCRAAPRNSAQWKSHMAFSASPVSATAIVMIHCGREGWQRYQRSKDRKAVRFWLGDGCVPI